jgi:hypothetical protein
VNYEPKNSRKPVCSSGFSLHSGGATAIMRIAGEPWLTLFSGTVSV